MASEEARQSPAEDALIKRIQSDLLPPPLLPQPATNEPGAMRLTLLGAGGCFASLAGALVAGASAPILIPGALVLLALAFFAPEIVSRMSNRWPFSLLPGSFTADPRRFAVTIALIVIPISGIAGLGIYRSVLFDSGNGSSAPPPVAALAVVPTPSATATLQTATEVPMTPTQTQVPVTPTPTPPPTTPTPSPSQTASSAPAPSATKPPSPELTSGQHAYLTALFSNWRIIENSNDSFNQLVDQQNADPKMVADPSWQKQMKGELDIWQTLYETSKDAKAPAGLEIINGKWIEFLGHKNLAADKLKRGIQQGDFDLIDDGNDELDHAANAKFQLSRLLDEFLARFNETPDVFSS